VRGISEEQQLSRYICLNLEVLRISQASKNCFNLLLKVKQTVPYEYFLLFLGGHQPDLPATVSVGAGIDVKKLFFVN
jgi:hypothetical protein